MVKTKSVRIIETNEVNKGFWRFYKSGYVKSRKIDGKDNPEHFPQSRKVVAEIIITTSLRFRTACRENRGGCVVREIANL